MSHYPIPVEDFTGSQALTIVCEKCHCEEVISADDILNEDLYECPRDSRMRPLGIIACGGFACMKYAIADRCGGCDELGWFADELNGCCSRSCMLIAEHRKALAQASARKGEGAPVGVLPSKTGQGGPYHPDPAPVTTASENKRGGEA